MDLLTLADHIDARTARAFVSAARHVIDAMLIEGERTRQASTPAPRDYASAVLDRSAPGGGWISPSELRSAAQRLSEAVAAEKWTEGFVVAMQLLMMVRP